MHKLVRNIYASKQILYDPEGGEIKWSFIEKLVEYGKKRNFNMMHKLNEKHIQWRRNIMKVIFAVQTLSASTAGSLEFLMKEGELDFQDAVPTIRFIKIFDKLFDIFNSKYDNGNGENIFKRALCPENRVQVFALFEEAIDYIENLQIIEHVDSNAKIKILKSRSHTGFSGYVSNMRALKLIYQEYVEQKQILTNIPMHRLGQDHLEIFFGRSRALCGHNDNPTVEQFQASFRKLLVFDTILCSKYTNCSEIDVPNQPLGNILYVSSRPSLTSSDEEDVSPAELETLLQKLTEVEALENNCLIDTLQGYTTAFIAATIENRIQSNHKIYCEYCKNIFMENAEMQNVYIGSKLKKKPCQSTFEICKTANRFLKLRLLSNQTSFTQIHAGISSCLDIGQLFPSTDFSHDFEHKIYFVKAIVDIYVQIKGTFLAKTISLNTHKDLIRSKMRKLIHVYGQ